MLVETREVIISLDHPRITLIAIRKLLQHALDQRLDRVAGIIPLAGRHYVVVIDADTARGRFLAQLVAASGHQPLVVARAVEAFTLFLQDAYIPLAILLVREDDSERLFLGRLAQHVMQRYHWSIPLVRLHAEPVGEPLSAAQINHPISDHATMVRRPVRPPRMLPMPQAAPPPLQASRASQPLPALPSAHPSRSLPIVRGHTSPRSPVTLAGIATQEPVFVIKEVEKKSLEGQNLGRYQFVTSLGGSQLSHVYIAYDRLRETQIAVKSLQKDALPDGFLDDSYQATNLFQQEVDLLANLKHPHILRIMSAAKSYISGSPFYYKTMPYYPESSLAAWRFEYGKNRPYSPAEIMPVARQVADALQYAHSQQVCHQNLKLTNLLIEGEAMEDMRRLHILLADFALTGEDKSILRTPESLYYLAPEQWSYETLPASDQYSLAALLYELLAGRPPFQGNQQHLLKHMHLAMQPQRPSAYNPAVSPVIDKIVLHALEKNPHNRFASIAEFEQALQASM